ncbi:MAG: hypothetical protein PHZ03_09135 [Syntrophomonas sp.]|nr:hypothetical protein [Syntrophomonas sp.]
MQNQKNSNITIITHVRAAKCYEKYASSLKLLEGLQAMDVLEILEARHQIGSTIFCSQFDPRGWHEQIDEAAVF